MRKDKFVNYTIVTFTYGVGLGTASIILFAFATIIKELIW